MADTMVSKDRSRNGDANGCTSWRSQAGLHNGVPKPFHTKMIESRSQNIDPSQFTQW